MRSETIGNAILYCGDAREILQSLQADVLITDPVWPNCPADLLHGAEDPYGLFLATCALIPEVKRMVVVLRHDSDPRFLQPVPLPYTRAVWLPYVMPGYIGRLLGGDEIAYCFGDPIPSKPGQRVIPGRADPEQPAGRKANGHPCSRAVGHFRWLTRWWSEEGETVLDPFMGSGTTGVAAVTGNRKFIGIEIEPKYFDVACKRIDAELAQQRLFA